MAAVTIKDLDITLGGVSILKSMNLEVQAGEFLVLLGPSGCGKSTLLHTIAGFNDVSEGSICIAGKDGWAVPTATDITLGLAAITLFARKFGLRAKFLALATIDDLLGLLILLIFFSAHISVAFLALTFLALLGLAFSQRFSYRISEPLLGLSLIHI